MLLPFLSNPLLTFAISPQFTILTVKEIKVTREGNIYFSGRNGDYIFSDFS